jgi:AcrR family transcriptional regulator
MATAPAQLAGSDEGSARRAILDATSALLQTESLDELSVAQILEGAGISRATFYFYFASKDDAFLALLSEVIDAVVPEFEAIMADPERRRPPRLLQEIARWLSLGGPRRAVMSNAIEEWPRRQDLRPVFLAGVDRLESAVSRAIDEDRAAGVAIESVPSAQLAAGLVWTLERTWHASISGAEPLSDLPAVSAALAATFTAAIYGR